MNVKHATVLWVVVWFYMRRLIYWPVSINFILAAKCVNKQCVWNVAWKMHKKVDEVNLLSIFILVHQF